MELKNEIKIEKLKNLSFQKLLTKLFIFIIGLSLVLFGIISNKILILAGIGIIFTPFIIKGVNSLYSVLMVLYLLHSTYFTLELGFEWTSLYYLVAILIVAYIIIKKIVDFKIYNFTRDTLLYLMVTILLWGILSAIFSTQVVQSFKNILSVFLVFVIFYIIPLYFFNDEEKEKHLSYMILPSHVVMTMLTLINLLYFLNFIDAKVLHPNWTLNSTIYINSNGYGLTIVVLLIITNILLLDDKRFKQNLKKSNIIKIYILLSYFLMLTNLLISGSRASLLGVFVAFIPLMIKKKKEMLILIGIVGFTIFKFSDKLLLFRKISIGTMSGRGEIWNYVFYQIIAKYPVLGIGSGAMNDYMGVFKGLSPHNSYLNIIMQIGFIGFMFWMFVLALIFYRSFKLINNKYIYIFAILGFMAFSMFESSLFGGMGLRMSIFWTIVMLIEYKLSMNKCNVEE